MPNPLGDFSYTWPYYAAAVIGYLLGSIPFGLVVTKLAGFGDIRSIGSGNLGTTNVLRTGRKDLAALTLLLDGGGAFLGHLFPVLMVDQWYDFHEFGCRLGNVSSLSTVGED